MDELILEEHADVKVVATFEHDGVIITDYEKVRGGWLDSCVYTVPYDHLSKIIVAVASKLAEKEAQR